MANGTNGTPQQQNPANRQGNAPRNGPRKADVIIQITKDISKKQEDVRNQTQIINSRLNEIDQESKENAQEALKLSDNLYNSVLDGLTSFKQELTYLAAQSENIYLNLTEKLAELNQAVEELKSNKAEAAGEQQEEVEEVQEQEIVFDYDTIADKLAERLPQPEVQETVFDYDLLSDKIAAKIPAPVQSVSSEGTPVTVVTQPAAIDYDELSEKVASHIPVQEVISTDYIASKVAEQIVIPSSAGLDIDYDTLAKKVAQYVGTAPAAAPTPVVVTSGGETAIDYEYLADKVADKILAAQSENPLTIEIDYDALADKVADRLLTERPVETTATEIDLDALADKVAERIPAYEHVESFAAALPSSPAEVHIDEDEIADRIALKVGTIKAEDFDIIVDDDGCDSISKAIAEKLDYDVIAAAVSEKLRAALDIATNEEPDYEEMANRIGEKIHVATVSEDVIADKAAAALSNYLPDIDTDEIADKVVNQILGALPAYDDETLADKVADKVVNSLPVAEEVTEVTETVEHEELDLDALAEKVADKVVSALPQKEESEEEETEAEALQIELDYDVLADKVADKVISALPNTEESGDEEEAAPVQVELDYDVLADKVATQVVNSLTQDEEETPVNVELDYDVLAEKVATQVINALPEDDTNAYGAVVAGGSTEAQISEEDLEKVTNKITETTGARFDSIDKDLEEIKAKLDSGVVVAELAPAAAEQTITEDNEVLVTVSDVVSQTEEPSNEETYEEDALDPKTQPSEEDGNLGIGDEFSETSGGVDFIHMMKYNRSFIARIIQGTDDQKEYYGRIKNALLSYKKVNSNIAWGAERFHKGRETIARLKIRGKTLILYLKLDPAEVPYSVYHQKDVSDNKSLNGTPLAVKVMSPLGVKKAIRLIDMVLEKRDGIKRPIPERNYADMYPYETIEELIDDGLVQDVRKP